MEKLVIILKMLFFLIRINILPTTYYDPRAFYFTSTNKKILDKYQDLVHKFMLLASLNQLMNTLPTLLAI